jgi:hypothetical protein
MVCSSMAPRSKVFAPSPVHVVLRSEGIIFVSCSLVLSLLQYWIESKFERLALVQLRQNSFELVVFSLRLASFIVSLGGIHHGCLVALFSLL